MNDQDAFAPERRRATVRILDDFGDPVSGATVTGSFNETRSGVTNSSGVAVIITNSKKKHPSFTFCVDNVTHATLTYDSGDNEETCDSYP